MKYDEVIETTGEFGRFQCYTFLLFGLFPLWNYHAVATPFIAMEVDHWCHIGQLNNFTKDEQRYIAIPYDEEGHYDNCKRFNLNFSLLTPTDLLSRNRSEWSDMETVPCERWNYDTSDYHSSAVITYDLVCDNNWLISFTSTLFVLGGLVGAFTGGVISDKYGRKVASMTATAIVILGAIMCVSATNYVLFGFGRFIAGVGRIAIYAIGIIYILEVTGKKYRSHVGMAYTSMFGLGYCIMPWVAKACKNDIYFQLAITLPTILYFSYWWIFPESPRWLLVNKHFDDAERAIQHISKINGRKLDPGFYVRDIEVEQKKSLGILDSILHVFKGPVLRKRGLIVFYVWFTIVLQYYAVALNVASMPGDIYLTSFYFGAMEVIGTLLCIPLTNWRRMGRRITQIILMVGTGLAGFVCIPLLYYGYDNALLAAVLFGRFCLTAAFGLIYFYTPELFPTEVRNSILGASSTIGRISGMMAAFIGGPLSTVWWALPNVIYGVMGTTAGLLCLLLPETLGQRMCETIDEAEGRTMSKLTGTKSVQSSLLNVKETNNEEETNVV